MQNVSHNNHRERNKNPEITQQLVRALQGVDMDTYDILEATENACEDNSISILHLTKQEIDAAIENTETISTDSIQKRVKTRLRFLRIYLPKIQEAVHQVHNIPKK